MANSCAKSLVPKKHVLFSILPKRKIHSADNNYYYHRIADLNTYIVIDRWVINNQQQI